MKIALITGARGFVGRHMARALHRQGVQVCGIGHGAWTEAERASWGVTNWLNAEVTKSNLDIIRFNIGLPDVVFHLAGGSSVGPSLLAPEEDFRRSVVSSAELLEWSRLEAPEARLVLASSAAVYGAGHDRAIRESDATAPYSPYGYHKRMAEELFESYGKNFGLNVAIVRLFSVYGPELRKQLLWDVCGRLASDATCLALGGAGTEMRDWLHITDAVALLQAALARSSPEGFVVNGGTGISVSVRDIAERLCAGWSENTQLKFSGTQRRGDPQYLVADVARSELIGFKPMVTWQAGVTDYVAWFKRVSAKGDA